MDPFTIFILVIVNFFLSFYSVIVGGGSLIMVPLLISLGVPVPNSVAIARFYNVGTAGSSLFEFNRKGKVNWKIGTTLAICAILGTIAGSYMVLNITEFLLKRIIAGLIIFVLIIMITKRDLGTVEIPKCGITKKIVGCIMTFFTAFVATLVGGGSGIFLTYILIFLFGQTFIQSMGTRKVITIAGLISSTLIFMVAGTIIYEIAVPLLITGTLGGYVGSKFALKKGDKWVRVFFMIIVAIMAINMFIQL